MAENAPGPTESETVGFLRVQEKYKTTRFVALCVAISVPVCFLIVCGTIVAWKWLERPAWLELMLAVLSPTGIVATIFWVLWRKIFSRQTALDERLTRVFGPNGKPPRTPQS
jgi:hypothetical protein